MVRNFSALPTALSLAVVLVWSSFGASAAPINPKYALKPGQRLTYVQDYRTDSRSDARSLFEQGDGAVTDASLVNELLIHLQARMQVEVLEQDVQGWLLSIRWERLVGTITANGRPQTPLMDALRKGLALPLTLHLEQEGRFGPIHLDPGLEPSVAAITRTLLSQMQCIIPRSVGPSWAVVEEDPAGRFEAIYKIEGSGGTPGLVRLRKWLARNLPAEQKARPGELKVDRSTQVTGSRGMGFDTRYGHFVSMEGHEVQRTLIAGKTVAGSNVRSSLRLAGVGHLKAESLQARRAWALARVQETPATTLWVEATWAEQETAVQRKALGESTLEELLAALKLAEAKGEKDGGALYLKLKALAYIQPEACARMGEQLARENAEGLSMRLLASALGTTGSLPCQEALASAIRSRREDWPALSVLLPSLGQSPDPSPASIALLEELASGSTVVPVASTAQLMLGSMAFNLARQGAPERAEGIVTAALARLEAAKDPVLAARFLLCLGNAGSSKSLPALKTWSATPDAELRALAFYALRWIEATEVDPLLLKALASDPEAQVRYKVIEAFKYRPPSPALVASLGRALAEDASPRVRLAALGSLWDLRTPFPEVMKAVEGARKDPDEDVRNLAESFHGK
jgi:hypothetical protein